MVVLVAGDDVEDHASELLFRRLRGEAEAADHAEGLLVGVRFAELEVEVVEGGEGLHVELVAVRGAVEAAGHEVASVALFEQAALGHLDPGGARHLGVGPLDRAVATGVAEVAAGVVDAVELEDPELEAGGRVDLARPHFFGLRVPGDQRLRPGAAGRGADAEDLLHRVAPAGLGERLGQVGAIGEHLAGQIDQRGDVELIVDGRVGAARGHELERAHPALTDVGEALDRIEAARRPSLRRQPSVDQRVAEAVRERVGDQPGEAVEGGFREFGEAVDATARRGHPQR